jgi:hypothetical protein
MLIVVCGVCIAACSSSDAVDYGTHTKADAGTSADDGSVAPDHVSRPVVARAPVPESLGTDAGMDATTGSDGGIEDAGFGLSLDSSYLWDTSTSYEVDSSLTLPPLSSGFSM